MPKITTALFGELALIPNEAERPIVEDLSFLTDVIPSQNGGEERFALRSMPRQSLQYSIPIQAWNLAKVFNTEYGAIRKRWAVPIWTEAQYVGSVAALATEVNCNTVIYDLRANSLALLYSSCDVWQIVEISTKTNSKVDVSNDLEAMAGAWIVPIRLGWISGNIDKPTNGHNGKSSIRFEIEDNLELTPAAPTQYLSNDIYYEPTLKAQDTISKNLQRQVDVVDYDLGAVYRRSNWQYSRYGSPYRAIVQGAAQIRAYKEFLYRRAGKFRQFWMPTFENNLRLTSTGNIVSTIIVENDSLVDYTLRTHIAIQALNGTWYARAISNPVQLPGDKLQFTLSSALNVNASLIARISFLGLHRFDTDVVQLRWIGNGVVESEANILEIAP